MTRKEIDLRQPVGPDLTPGQMAKALNYSVSVSYLRLEIRDGHLEANRVGRKGRRYFKIRYQSARAYALQRGFLKVDSTPDFA